MDILGGMSNANEGSQMYLAFKTQQQQWYVNGETPIEFTYMQVDPASFKSGWGKYTPVSGYEYVWDNKFGVMDTRPDEDFRRAFSAWVMPQGTASPLLWQRFTYAESTAFNQLLGTFWNAKETAGQNLPVVKYEGSKEITIGMGKSSEITFSFAKFAPRADGFVVPSWYYEDTNANEEEFKSPNDGLQDLVNKQINESNDLLNDEDIPF